MMKKALAIAIGLLASLGGAQSQADDTEKALAAGLKPLSKLEICPPLFEGPFGVDKLPTQAVLMQSVQERLKGAGIPFILQEKHRETVVTKKVLDDRKTTGWLHIRVLASSLNSKKVKAFRVVFQIQSPVAHPGDAKTYVFANLYEDIVMLAANDELAPDVITNGINETVGRLCDRWISAHEKK